MRYHKRGEPAKRTDTTVQPQPLHGKASRTDSPLIEFHGRHEMASAEQLNQILLAIMAIATMSPARLGGMREAIR